MRNLAINSSKWANFNSAGKQCSILEKCIWAISNLTRGKPRPNYTTVMAALPLMVRVLKEADNEDVLADALWAVCYLTEGNFLLMNCIYSCS
jgi:hypothetical protein